MLSSSAVADDAASFFESDPKTSALKLMTPNDDDYLEFQLIEKVKLSHDTIKFVFTFPVPEWTCGLVVGSHLILTLKTPEGKEVTHKYTPTSPINMKGRVEMVIKIYRKCEQFPDGGKLS
jgi:NAD(P)H-flavin reductase